MGEGGDVGSGRDRLSGSAARGWIVPATGGGALAVA
jgi:hypothetical protein